MSPNATPDRSTPDSTRRATDPGLELFLSLDSFCAEYPNDPLAATWSLGRDRLTEFGGSTDLIDFDAPHPEPRTPKRSRHQGGGTRPICCDDAVPLLMTSDEAAAYLNVKPRLIRRMVADKRLIVTKVGRFNRFTAENLDRVKQEPGPTIVQPVSQKVAEHQRPHRDRYADDPIARLIARSRASDTPGTTSSND